MEWFGSLRSNPQIGTNASPVVLRSLVRAFYLEPLDTDNNLDAGKR